MLNGELPEPREDPSVHLEEVVENKDLTQTRDEFERALLPLMLLALDGISPAIKLLETASSLRSTNALSKMLSKITK